ncbi:MAG: hypothetical protein N2320_01180 [Candidatus Bipolaricaulota bacterium]|nr:hypothetical protein [Candidatus Bipolaricaulota bacterium]
MGKKILVVAIAALGVLALGAEEEQLGGLGHGGFLAGVLPLEFAPLNEALSAAGYPTVAGPMLVFGGGGSGGVLGGAVFGGLGLGGTLTAIEGEKRTDLELGFGGMTIELVRPAGKTALLGLGLALGGGSLDLTARARRPADFADALANPPVSQLSLRFLGGLGYFRIGFQVLPWLAVDGWAGYFLTFPVGWEEGGREIAGPRVELRAPFFGIRISFGGIGLPEEPPAQ